MSRPFTTYGDHSTDYLSAQHPNSSPPDDFKSYNDDLSDLIDQYAQPYSRTSRHQTFAVSTDPLDDPDSRDRSFSTEQKGIYSVDKDNVVEEDTSNHDYPPPLKQEKPIDIRSCWAKILPDSWACRLFVLTVVIETAVDLAIEGDLLVRLQDDSGKLAVYVSVFALAHIFQLVMAVDAVYARNTLQFMSLIIFNLLFLLYAVIEIGEIKNSSTNSAGILHVPVNVLTDIIPAVISAAEIAYIGLGWKIYNEFGWKVYKFLGADRRIKKMYATYQIFECLVKFDIFFWVGFSVQFIWLVLQKNDWEYYVTWAALPLSILLLIEGHLAARHENKWMMGTFMFGSMGALVYFTYKLFRVLQYRETQYALYWKSLSTFSAIAIVLLVITMIFSVLVMRNFGRGLKASIARSKTHTQGSGSQHLNRGPMSTNPNRMSIE
ncbi:hypothetical protein CY34DRAFT_439633 [Suillus luteus UH-Slu-Lm8-n1]|uniref:Uncharacterized protein n=1 Tax=Suillus luteus UH-Slu-Lm8-n1 TaxID=930992 RepID=A0A0D0AX06_9AGAM|nr:hypothetical protein CY34DRAFT_439633 [Suillus luteus UH-Slu-Lm8-n1]